jgi:flagellar M-ring protein FliF
MGNVQNVWSQASIGKKTGMLVGVSVILIFIVVAVMWLLRGDYQVLFSDMSTRDAASVVKELDRLKVDYRLEEGGTKIVVPGDVVHAVRLKLMGSEMPIAGTVGLEIFNDSDFGMTEFAQKINFQRALQGELTRTIMSLEEVKYARVHLVMPERGLFKAEGKKASASVTLFLKKGVQLNSKQITGIQRLVSSSVQELESEMVTVLDERGQILSKLPSDITGIESISKRLEKQKEIESYYTGKITRLLAPKYKSEEIAVSVNVLLSYDQVRVTRDGVMGADGDISSGVIRRRESSTGLASRKDKGNGTKTTEIEYELGHQIEQTVEAPGRILRMSVGVLVPPGLSEEKRKEINELVAMAVGLDAARGDVVALYENDSISGELHELSALKTLPQDASIENSVPATVEKVIINDSSADVPVNKNGQVELTRYFQSDQSLYALAASLLAIFLLLLSWIILRRSRGEAKPDIPILSQADREKVLVQIQEWLSADEEKAQQGEARA